MPTTQEMKENLSARKNPASNLNITNEDLNNDDDSF
jgi:hypothetical protein